MTQDLTLVRRSRSALAIAALAALFIAGVAGQGGPAHATEPARTVATR